MVGDVDAWRGSGPAFGQKPEAAPQPGVPELAAEPEQAGGAVAGWQWRLGW